MKSIKSLRNMVDIFRVSEPIDAQGRPVMIRPFLPCSQANNIESEYWGKNEEAESSRYCTGVYYSGDSGRDRGLLLDGRKNPYRAGSPSSS